MEGSGKALKIVILGEGKYYGCQAAPQTNYQT
jgi:hypothetical protein